MFKHLLVPLDGSHLAEAALPAARFLSRSFGASVTLVHLMEKGRPQTVHDQPHLHDANEAAAYLSRVAASFPAGVPVDWHVHEDEVRRVAASIVEHCMKELHSDLVIMCAHGEGGTRRFVQSSIAQQVTAFGTVPVLVLHAEQSSHREFACNKVLMPVEAGQQHGDIFGIAEKFATSCAAVVRLISVAPTNGTIKGKWLQVGRLLPGATAELLDLEADQLGEFLGSKASALRAAGVTAETAVLRGDPGPVISLDAEESRADIIVMATHGKSGMSALWEGSVASRVFAESKSPLLLVPVAVTP
jgi:nucleotide-binding universal stress UspA family protein